MLGVGISWTRKKDQRKVEHLRVTHSRNSGTFLDVASVVTLSVTSRHSLPSSFRHGVTCR